ncbi:MAG: hypothetical protein EG826_05960 [Deltaproteobacteria bacterium]|nr:hypothetical protein [Deltaproteobacteria bacterium]
MRRLWVCLVMITGILFWSFSLYAAGESERRVVERALVAQGVDPAQAECLMQDPRIFIQSDIVIKNLFYSKPKGSRKNPHVMEVDPLLVERGKRFMKENAGTLSAVEEKFGTSPRIITAILIIESRLGSFRMPWNAANAYANLAFLLDPAYLEAIQNRYADTYPQLRDEAAVARAKRKAKWAAVELGYLVHLANHLGVDPLGFAGSFAGALGPAQFIPSSFWIFGIDGDQDGMADPLNMADANLSMGNYLRKYGWREDAPLEQKRKALWYYNHSDVYVNTVMMVYEKLGR